MTPVHLGFRSHWYKAICEVSLKSDLYFSQNIGNKLKNPIFGYVLWPRDLDLCLTWPLLKWVADLIDMKPYTNFHWNQTCTFLKNLVTSKLLTDKMQLLTPFFGHLSVLWNYFLSDITHFHWKPADFLGEGVCKIFLNSEKVWSFWSWTPLKVILL